MSSRFLKVVSSKLSPLCPWTSLVFWGDRESYAPGQVLFGVRVSEQEPLSLQKSAKSRVKNPNSLRSDMRIFAHNADFRKLRGSNAPANAPQREPVPELKSA